jgi:hypothetical protein
MNATWATATLSLGLWAASVHAAPTLGWPARSSDPVPVNLTPLDVDFSRVLREGRSSAASPSSPSSLVDAVDVHDQLRALSYDPLQEFAVPADGAGSLPLATPSTPAAQVGSPAPVISLDTLAEQASAIHRPADVAARLNDPTHSPFLVPLPPAALPGLFGVAVAIGVASWKRRRA